VNKLLNKIMSILAWPFKKVIQGAVYVREYRAEIQAKAEVVVAKVREVALTAHRWLVAKAYRLNLTYNYTMTSLGGEKTILEALAEAKSQVRKLSDAFIAEIQTVPSAPAN
jgi:hypothetical protein